PAARGAARVVAGHGVGATAGSFPDAGGLGSTGGGARGRETATRTVETPLDGRDAHGLDGGLRMSERLDQGRRTDLLSVLALLDDALVGLRRVEEPDFPVDEVASYVAAALERVYTAL